VGHKSIRRFATKEFKRFVLGRGGKGKIGDVTLRAARADLT